MSVRWSDRASLAAHTVRAYRGQLIASVTGIALGVAIALVTQVVTRGVEDGMRAIAEEAFAPDAATTIVANVNVNMVAESRHIYSEDADVLRKMLGGGPGIGSVSVIRTCSRSLSVAMGDYVETVRIVAADPGYRSALRVPVIGGRDLTVHDARANSRVVLADTSVLQAIGRGARLGSWIDVRGARQVVGLLGAPTLLGVRPPAMMLVPFGEREKEGICRNGELSSLVLSGDDEDDVDRAARAALSYLGRTSPPGSRGEAGFTAFKTDRQREVLGEFSDQMQRLSWGLLILSLGTTALVMGNVMAMLVADRSYELALRRAHGATRGEVFFQVLLEAVSATFIGLVIGVLLAGGALVVVAQTIPHLPLALAPTAVAGALLKASMLALITALVASAIPAWRAASPALAATLAGGTT